MTEPRGIRNNNPGNIRWGENWQGLVPEDQRTDKSFCQFVHPKYGIRAIAKIMFTYESKYGLNTIEKIISRWAPPNENNTEAYINAVSQYMGVPTKTPLDLKKYETMGPLVEAITLHENGKMPYSHDVINQGLILAGV